MVANVFFAHFWLKEHLSRKVSQGFRLRSLGALHLRVIVLALNRISSELPLCWLVLC
jgi:hypothetical protein